MHQHARLKQQKKKIKELVINAYFISKIKQVKWYRNECKSNYYIYIISKLKKKIQQKIRILFAGWYLLLRSYFNTKGILKFGHQTNISIFNMNVESFLLV